MRDHRYEKLATLFLALGDTTRLRLLGLLAGGPLAVGEMVDQLGESQPKVSRHLAYLRNAEVVSGRRDGKWIYYGIEEPDDPTVKRVLDIVVATIGGGEIEPLVVHDLESRGNTQDIGAVQEWTSDEPAGTESPELEIFLL